MIELKNIQKSYGRRMILTNFNITIDDGEFVVITGASGKGKTTLLNIIGLIEHADSGNVIINGVCNPEVGGKHWRKIMRDDIAFIFQNYGLVENKSIYENLFLGLSREKKDRKKIQATNALKLVGIEIPDKTKIFQLSGGEQQRVALAKILIKDPNIILADEPTGNLDANNKKRVLEILKEMNNCGKTVIIVTHDQSVCKYATKKIDL